VESKKLDFSFYDFSVIYYDFSSSVEINKKKKRKNHRPKPLEECYLTGFGKFRGRKSDFIVCGEVVHSK